MAGLVIAAIECIGSEIAVLCENNTFDLDLINKIYEGPDIFCKKRTVRGRSSKAVLPKFVRERIIVSERGVELEYLVALYFSCAQPPSESSPSASVTGSERLPESRMSWPIAPPNPPTALPR